MSNNINLLEETSKKIEGVGLSWDNVTTIGDSVTGATIPVSEFKQMASEFEYNNGFGTEELNAKLVIMFDDDTWLERRQEDGREWWELCRKPIFEEVNQEEVILKYDFH